MEEAEQTVVVFANAFDGAFAACWPAGSRLLLDLFEAAWGESTGGVDTRLRTVFESAGRSFVDGAPALHPAAWWLEDGGPGGTLFAVVASAAGVVAAWIGGDLAVLARGGEVVAATQPHTLVEHLRQQGNQAAVGSAALPAVVVRNIGLSGEENRAATVATLDWRPGDTLVLVNWSLHRGRADMADDVAVEAAKVTSSSELTEHLAERGFAREQPAFAAVAVLGLCDGARENGRKGH